jgi:hypothetical protein
VLYWLSKLISSLLNLHFYHYFCCPGYVTGIQARCWVNVFNPDLWTGTGSETIIGSNNFNTISGVDGYYCAKPEFEVYSSSCASLLPTDPSRDICGPNIADGGKQANAGA